ncbi:hypothetical protein BC830DRAFT_1078245 [Chytriomyces sp. MP71]|nr:hypothetical protein BC830DRAFT_1078245 [Chytriomyces sp. MP71]
MATYSSQITNIFNAFKAEELYQPKCFKKAIFVCSLKDHLSSNSDVATLEDEGTLASLMQHAKQLDDLTFNANKRASISTLQSFCGNPQQKCNQYEVPCPATLIKNLQPSLSASRKIPNPSISAPAATLMVQPVHICIQNYSIQWPLVAMDLTYNTIISKHWFDSIARGTAQTSLHLVPH